MPKLSSYSPLSSGTLLGSKTLMPFITVGPAGSFADYVCDGTADDVEIQAAVNSLGSTGGTIFVRKSIYDITAALSITNHVVIIGDGIVDANQLLSAPGGTVLKRNSSYDGPIFINSDTANGNFSITLKDFSIDGNSAFGSPTSLSRGIYFNKAQRTFCWNVGVNNTGGDGIRFLGSGGGVNWVSHCKVRGCTGNGISFGSAGATDCAAWNNEVGSCTGVGISLASVSDCIITNNFVFLNGSQGIDLFNAPRNTVSDNRVNTSGQSGIRLTGSTLTPSYCAVVGNRCYDNGTATTTGAGILLSDSNIGALYNTITGNVCYNSVGTDQKYGIRTTNNANFNVVSSNVCHGNTTAQISLAGSNDVVGNNIQA